MGRTVLEKERARDYVKKDPEAYKSQADRLKPYQFPKGKSGNPGGRGKNTISLTESLKKYFRRHPEQLEKVVIELVKQGRLGNILATKEMFDRVDGKVAETHKIESALPVMINFIPAEVLLKQTPALQDGNTVEGEIV